MDFNPRRYFIMLRKVCSTSHPLIVYNPSGVFDQDYFQHCAEAGAFPVFDTEFISDEDVISHLSVLAERGFLFGIRIAADRIDLINRLNSNPVPNCEKTVIYYNRIYDLAQFNPVNSGYPIIIEVTDIDINDILEGVAPEALILKGIEAQGKVSSYTSFVLLQWYAEKTEYPFFVHGGAGYFTAAGMFAAGASGIVLDSQLYLAEECPVSEQIRNVLSNLEESDSTVLTDSSGTKRRFFSKLGTKIVKDLKLKEESGFYNDKDISLYDEIESHYSPVDGIKDNPAQKLFYLGQDAVFAKYFVKKSAKISEIISDLFSHIEHAISMIDSHDPVVENSLLAAEHGTRYPIVQGPMANISDNAAFAAKIYENGALPFMAVGSLPSDIAENMLSSVKKDLPKFGAGMIGVPAFNKHLADHMEIVKKNKIPFALFAAGNPSLIKELEAAGTKAYLHTPSMPMLANAVSAGCRRLIFEGTEAGGHVGNLSSMVLWELALETVSSLPDSTVKELRLLFAGGIGTSRGSHFVSGMASSTAGKGCGIGVQVSTSYLFTSEIVGTGALGKLYQEVICREKGTLVIGDTVGLLARTVASPFSKRIHENEIRRVTENIPLHERKELFEHDNTGSLLISAKAFHLDFSDPVNIKKIPSDETEQYEKGNFMAGDIIACNENEITIKDVHDTLINRKEIMFRTLNGLELQFGENSSIRDEIAVIGIGCIYPDASGPDEFWNNIVSKKYSISEMPETRLKPFYYSSDKKAEDRTYSKIAGIVKDYKFDYEHFGYSPDESERLSRSLKMILEASDQAVSDAGYNGSEKKLPAERTAVIIASCLTNELNSDLQLKYYYPEILSRLEQVEGFISLGEIEKQLIRDRLKEGLAQGHHGETADCSLIDKESSGVASFFGIEGLNYTIDAACASSMAALDAGRRELLSGSHDMVIVGGVNTNLSVETFVGFCKMGALSAEGSFPFDERAGGFVLGEGAGVVVIKRMKDALRDGDKIHAVFKGIGSSSDGKGKAIAAPNPEGQEIALRRCYDSICEGTGVSDIGYIEAHGTSTLMGDYAELETLKKFFNDYSSPIGLSSVKSQIGHLLGGAGLAGIIKVIMAIKNRALPSNGLYKDLSHRFNLSGSPLYIIKDAAPWEVKNGKVRTAAVSSFGFGGINYHCVIGEMTGSYAAVQRSRLFKSGSGQHDRRIVIAGMGVMLPGISGSDELKDALNTGRNFMADIPLKRFSSSYYMSEKDEAYSLPMLKAGVIDDSVIDGRKYRMPPATVRSVDRCQFIGLECTKQALEQSKQNENIQKGNNIAIIVGTASGEKMVENIIRTRLPLIEKIISEVPLSDKSKSAEISARVLESLKERYNANNEDTVPGLLSNVVSGRIANFFGFNGANFIINDGAASSDAAIRLAYLGLQSGEYESVITGGVDSNLTPASFIALKQRGLTSVGKESGGIIDQESISLSEGGALFMLTTYENAVKKGMPVLAVLDDSAFNTHADSPALNVPGNNSDKTFRINFNQRDASGIRGRGTGYYRSAEAAVSLAGEVVTADDRVNTKSIAPVPVLMATEKRPDVIAGHGGFKNNQQGSIYTESDGSLTTLLLSGQGAQRAGMMKELYSSSKIVRDTLDTGETIFCNERGYSLLDLMFGDDPAINSTENTQPAVFLSSAAVFNVLSSVGFNPRYYIGHSLGECTALYCSGILGFEDTMKLVLKRSSLMKESADKTPGEILALFKGWEESLEHIKRSGVQDVYPANRNSDAQTVIAGKPEGISEFIGYMKRESLIYKKLPLSGAFHTPLFSEASVELRNYLAGVKFSNADYTKVISNVTAQPYPQDENAVKDLLAKQVILPVQFTESVRYACSSAPCFIEAGPSGVLTGLLKNISCGIKKTAASVDYKKGETVSLDETLKLIKSDKNSEKETLMNVIKSAESSAGSISKTGGSSSVNINTVSRDDAGFREYVENHRDDMDRIMYDEYLRYSLRKEIAERDSFGFYTGSIVISGVSIGLPGKSRDVFSDDNFECILKGENRIELLSSGDLNSQLDKNITRVKKSSNGNAVLQELKSGDDVVQLAGQLGHFNKLDYGIEYENDKSDALAMAAGIEALRDAGIPLVPQRRKTSTGSYLFNGYALPDEMQETTGIIRSTIFPGFDSIIDEVARYTTAKNINGPYRLFEKIYYYIMETVQNEEIKQQITEWFFSLKKHGADGDYSFNRNLLLKLGFMGAPQFAQMIQAKGPNTQINAACASVTQGISMAEDWLRAGRCERVIVIGSEAVEPENLGQWLYSGFLAMGAATVEKNVFNAAKPFDALRNGTIIGSGAAAVIVERADAVQRRGRAGQAEILGTVTGNSAFHGTRIDVSHITEVMGKMINKAEKRHGLVKEDYTKSMIFMSHETFTPAIGGSAQAEINAIRGAYPDHYRNIVISNTKGYTGHTLGGGLEDPVMVKALQSGIAPAIANLNEVPGEFSDLRFSRGERGVYNYGLHFSAGFGSHYALLFTRRIEETSSDNSGYVEWLRKISGDNNPELTLVNRSLCIKSRENAEPAVVNQGAVKDEIISSAPISLPEPAYIETVPVQPAVSAQIEMKSAGVDISTIKDGIKGVIAEQTGYTTDMLDDGLDLEADLGIDTVKQVEIFGKISALYSLEVPEDLKLSDMNTIDKLVKYIASKVKPAQPAVSAQAESKSAGVNISVIKDGIKGVIAEQTGYTTDMLDDGLDLEADLGIDTVKQVEIFGKISALYSLEVPEDLKLSDMNTIDKLVNYIASKVSAVQPAVSAQTEIKSAGVDISAIKDGIKGVIAEQTGYTTDMLDDGLDLEADLGIDTVKQVEIFGKISALYSLEVPEDLKLSDMNTIDKLVKYIASKVKPAQPAVSAQTESKSAGVDISAIKDGIKGVIAEQTGYTVDMLDDGLDLEADLGIDTVKQVEIFGKISALYSLEVPEDLKLSDMNTIDKLVKYIASKVSTTQPAAVHTAAQGGVIPAADAANGIHRFTISVKVLDAVNSDNRDFSGKTFLISRDNSGYTEKISEMIKENGGIVFTLGNRNADCIADMTDPADVEQKVSAFAAGHEEINSFIHLSPLDYIISGKDRTPECIESSVKSFFVIIKTMNEMLRRKGSIIAALSFNSVVFPYCENPGKIYPVSGAIAGMLKTVNKEFGDAVVKAVDFSAVHPEKMTGETADLFIKELLSGDTRVEVGYRGSERYGLTLNDKAAAKGESLVRDGSTLLVTGGAGGITFEILKKFAGDFRNLKLIIFDRLDIDSIRKEFLPVSVDESFIISVLKKKMQDAKPFEIKNAAAQIMRTKKAYSNMAVLKSMGVRVDYHAVDVNSADAVVKALKKYKRIDGVIHAAGMEESQVIEKMTIDSFNRVFNVKGYGVLNLISALSRIEYDFFAAFSSVAARFGNEGQVNYSCANEMLAKALFSERASHKNRVYKICDWTAWEGAGMATNETVNKVLKERGMTFLPLEQGIDLFMKELRDETDVETIFTGMDLSFDKDGILPDNKPSAGSSSSGAENIAPFLDRIIETRPGHCIFSRTIDMKRDLFMGDHTKDGIPLFLGATGIETMAEAARYLAGEGAVLSELRDFTIPYSIKILKGRPKELMIEAAEDKNSQQGIVSRITSQFKNPGGIAIGDPTLHYEGRYLFSGTAEQPLIAIPKAKAFTGDADFQETIYHPQRLFMDGVFRTVQGIHSFDGELLVTRMKHAQKREFFSGVTDPAFIVDVVLIDAMFQTGGIFEMLTTSEIILPSKINRMVFHGTPDRNREYLCFTRKLSTDEESTTFTLILADHDGRVYMEIDRFDMVKITRVPESERIDKLFRIAG
jgi:acyl transferase domain-containing protein/NAD(P)H-dependent flavin oxidoreductase YrpB (nitropropane dioxygenase family)/acyl carrier protein/NAD(P)-dependent dehydrogenase (short-subunit alcohol dehydrogenase family)